MSKSALSFFGYVVRAATSDGIANDAGNNGRSARKRQTILHLARQYNKYVSKIL